MRIRHALGFAPLILAAACATADAPSASAQSLTVRPSAEQPAVATAIPDVIAAGAEWSLVWQGSDTADGLVASPDGGIWFAQEQTSEIIALAPDDTSSVYRWATGESGSLSINTRGELLAVQRTCTDFGLHLETCPYPSQVAALAPESRVLATKFADGRGLGRLNDLAADSRGGAYFTVGGAYYAAPDGAVTTVVEGEGVRTNGIVLSPDEATLYVTNGPAVLAFDVGPDGATSNEREFARLDDGDGGDGMTVDAEGRLYVTGVGMSKWIYVFAPDGGRLGVIPVPRQPVSITFAGPDKRTLYLSGMGALDADGQEHAEPEGERNAAMSVYKIPMLAQGFLGRPK